MRSIVEVRFCLLLGNAQCAPCHVISIIGSAFLGGFTVPVFRFFFASSRFVASSLFCFPVLPFLLRDSAVRI